MGGQALSSFARLEAYCTTVAIAAVALMTKADPLLPSSPSDSVQTPACWTSTLTTSLALCMACSGAAAWISPDASLKTYGLASNDTSASMYMRQVGAWQIVAALVFRAGLKGAVPAAKTALSASAICVLACIPVNEYFERSKPEALSGVIMLLTLGKLVSLAKVSSASAPPH